MEKKEVWELARRIMRRFMLQYEDAMDTAALSIGLDASGCLLVIIPAYQFEPDPISAVRLRKRIPYNSPAYYEKPLRAVKNAGFLDTAPEGGYILNQRGHEAYSKIMSAAYQQMEQLVPLSAEKMEELKLLLAKLVQASILSPEFVSKWSILHSRRLDPGRDASPMITIDQYLSDLASYRDDAHLASWSSRLGSAHAWDILGVLWQGKASSTASTLESVRKRCWTEGETHTAIDELAKKGWITTNGEKLDLTQEGRLVRKNAEELTDQFFFSPWRVLTDIEYKEMCELLTQLNENFGSIEAPP